MVVRVQTDAYVPNAQMRLRFRTVGLQDTALASGIAHNSSQQTTIIAKDIMVSQAATIELKSNDSARPLEQMWFGHTRYCCLGKQKIALLTNAEVKFVNHEEFEEWESKQQDVLQKLAWLLQELRTVVKEKTSEGSAVLVSLGEGEPIEVFEAKRSVDTLPKEIVEKSWAWWYTAEATV